LNPLHYAGAQRLFIRITIKSAFRTRFQIEARRTNLNIDEAVTGITDKLADQIAGLF
jgi:hypothetical protein